MTERLNILFTELQVRGMEGWRKGAQGKWGGAWYGDYAQKILFSIKCISGDF